MRMIACFLAIFDGPHPGMRDNISFDKYCEKFTRRQVQQIAITTIDQNSCVFDDEHVKIWTGLISTYCNELTNTNTEKHSKKNQ